jgi:hypothetical protein
LTDNASSQAKPRPMKRLRQKAADYLKNKYDFRSKFRTGAAFYYYRLTDDRRLTR